jgi:phosphoenolpyruvate carboxykinase (ATP)
VRLPGFNFEIPTAVPGVESHLLNPQRAWADSSALAENTRLLMTQFIQNFNKFDVSDEILSAGPALI